MEAHPRAIEDHPWAMEAQTGVVWFLSLELKRVISGIMEDHPGAMEAHPGTIETHPQATEAHLGAIEAYPVPMEAYPGPNEIHL